MGRVVYRIVRSDPPTLDDFLSDESAGKASTAATPELRRLASGRSVYNTEAQARRKARAYPVLGRYIAAVELPEHPAIRMERTLASAGHHTLWADPELLLANVVAVVPV